MHCPQCQVAWLAGLFDGEGCLAISCDKRLGKRSYIPQIFLSNEKFEVLDDVKKEWGGSLATIKNVRKHIPPHKLVWSLCIPQTAQLSFLLALLPFLKIKREQAEVLISFLKAREFYRKHRRRKFSPGWYPLAEESRWHLKRLKGRYSDSKGNFIGEMAILYAQETQAAIDYGGG